ncbi:MAG: TonB-dependent receptor, partial [Cyanobacteria bacterium J06636_27]
IKSGNLRGWGLGLGLYYVGERQGDLNNSFSLPSYLRTDASLFYRRSNLAASLNFQNLFDVNYYQGARNDLRVIPGAPFTVFGKVSLEF